MKKVAILSYYFPPANFVGADRVAAWAKHLPQKDIFSVIITRQWNENQVDLTTKIEKSFLSIEKGENYEIHRLPFRNSLRDRLSNYPSLKIFQKALTLFELVFSNFFIRALPYSNFYFYTSKYLEQNKDVCAVIISGRPFQSFFIGYLLKKRHPSIHWIPDYRDEWNSHQQRFPKNMLERLVFFLERRSEKKWTSNASFFISVSDFCINSIGSFIDKKGYVIMNGYSKIEPVTQKTSQTQELSISYIGTLYQYQEIETIIQAVINVHKKTSCPILFTFVGISVIPEQVERVKRLTTNFEHLFKIVPRISKAELQQFYNQSDLLFLTAYNNINAWQPVKLFEYFEKNIPILLCPSDHGAIQSFIEDTNCGYIASSVGDCEKTLLDLFQEKIKTGKITKAVNFSSSIQYSREYQSERLASLINNL